MRGATTSAADGNRLDQRFASAISRLSFAGGPAAIALSGGGDSMALMHLFADWARERGGPLPDALIVDHDLRDGSGAEAARVAGWATAIAVAAHVLRRKGPRPRGSIEEKARAARYGLMGEWCRLNHTGALFVAHTLDDQAETFLLRLARGSGVDGLSGMRPRGPFPVAGFLGVEVIRPLLEFTRAELRVFLKERGVLWVEDPMNKDPHFARTRIRALMPQLEAAGLAAPRIVQAAAHLLRARDALEEQTAAFLDSHARILPGGSIFLDAAALSRVPREIGLRALGSALMRVSGEPYRPRFERLERLFDAVNKTGTFIKTRTLHCCRIGPVSKRDAIYGAGTIRIAREPPRKSGFGGKKTPS